MSERTKHHPDTCTCMWCAKELRAALATVTAERDHYLKLHRDVYSHTALDAERSAHADTRKALEFERDCLAAEKKAHEHCWQRKVLHIEERDTARAELATALRESSELIAQRDTALGALKAERLAHAETRKALEDLKTERNWLTKENARLCYAGQADIAAIREQMCADLAKVEARVKEADRLFTVALFYRPTPEWADEVRGWMKELQGG